MLGHRRVCDRGSGQVRPELRARRADGAGHSEAGWEGIGLSEEVDDAGAVPAGQDRGGDAGDQGRDASTQGHARAASARGGTPRWNLAEWGAELVGTAVLLLGGVSAICLDFGAGSPVATVAPSPSLRLLLTGMLFAACGSLFAISPLGRLSGAHLNPSVTFGFWLHRRIEPVDVLGYMLAQCLGALLGVGVARLAWGQALTTAPVNWARTSPGHGLSAVAVAGVEALMTGVLLATIFLMVSHVRTARWTPLAVWVVVAVEVWQGAPYTGTSLNPARTLAPDLLSATFPAFWAYVAGPLGGATLAWLAVAVLARRRALTAKLFHDPRYRSVLRSELPVLATALESPVELVERLPWREPGRPRRSG